MSRWSVSASHVGPPSLIPQNRSQRTLIPGTLRHTGKISAISPASRSRQFFRHLAAHRGCSSSPGRRAAKWAISGPAAARDTSWAAKAKRPPTSDNISNDVSLSTESPDAMQEKPVQILGIHDLRTARGQNVEIQFGDHDTESQISERFDRVGDRLGRRPIHVAVPLDADSGQRHAGGLEPLQQCLGAAPFGFAFQLVVVVYRPRSGLSGSVAKSPESAVC